MKPKKKLQVRYSFADHEQKERQKRIDDAFESIFEELELKEIERINDKNEYEHPVIVKG